MVWRFCNWISDASKVKGEGCAYAWLSVLALKVKHWEFLILLDVLGLVHTPSRVRILRRVPILQQPGPKLLELRVMGDLVSAVHKGPKVIQVGAA